MSVEGNFTAIHFIILFIKIKPLHIINSSVNIFYSIIMQKFCRIRSVAINQTAVMTGKYLIGPDIDLL